MSKTSAPQSAAKISVPESASENYSEPNSARNIWQHPFVDVFKHFKLMPTQDWKQNKKQGDVSEQFEKEIGRKVMVLNGNISANNYIQIPSPTCAVKSLQLTGRYMYVQFKAPMGSVPFTFHVDLQLVERSHGIRISCSNLYKTLQSQNGFVCQLPLNVQIDQWTVACIDIHEALRQSGLLQQHTMLSYQIKQIMLCANSMVRGVFTSDNLYSFQSLPPDMKFKYSFPTGRWLEYFSWIDLPQDIGRQTDASERKPVNINIPDEDEQFDLTQEQKENLQREVQKVLEARNQAHAKKPEKVESKKMNNVQQFPQVQESFEQLKDELEGVSANEKFVRQPSASTAKSAKVDQMAIVTGQYINDNRRSEKLNLDPILELKHIIGFSPSKCADIKWSRVPGESVILYASEGALIAMDVENGEQRRFFFGHNQPICCFDIAPHGGMLASAQEGQFSIVRIWDYYTARCISMLTLPCSSLISLAFSPDGQYLATVGKSSAKVGKTVQYNKELLIIWDLSKIHKGEKPEIAAKHTLEYNILALKFSPIDNSRLVSCGKENIRFWRVRDQGTIRGSAVVLNQHARNTVFTALDFEWGCTATGPYCPKGANNERGIMNHVSPENESLKRVFVGSRHGMVFQINYKTEQLEATYRTNETAIQSIAVNEAFCVTGSDDQFLRVWPLDFSEFFMEAKHEGSVMNVQISPDGLKVVCGTRNGSIGVLNKSNQKYRTLLRAHTAAVLGIDFHVPRKAIITVSADATIRLWDSQFFDQSVEFSSPIDQPISVAAHPTLPIFSCGFSSGSMRIFDIEKTCLADEFTQFNKALKKLRYSPCGSLLVAVCEDGSVSLHDCRRQHLPSKMMHLEQAPRHVHVAFTPLVRKTANKASLFADASQSSFEGGNVQVQESMFGVMGEYGNMCMIYDTDSIILRHSVQAGQQLRAFEFSKDGHQLVCLLNDQKIRFYSLESFDGVLTRELPNTHRTSINAADLTLNGGFMMTAGEDSLVKVWDSEAPKSVPYFYQAFIGHTYGVQNVLINPADQGQVCTTAGEDGVFVWQFSGDTTTNFFPEKPEVRDEAPNEEAKPGHLTMLEKMRAQVKDKQRPKLDEYCFILPNFQNLPRISETQEFVQTTLSETREFYETVRDENHLTYNHFVTCQNKKEFEVDLELKTMLIDQTSEKVVEPCIVNGFDGFSGTHSNLIWNWQQNSVVYTLNNKVIIEDMKTRNQVVLANSQVRLSCLSQSADGRLLVAAEGETNPQKVSLIYVYNNHKLSNKLTFHQKGVQSLQFVRKNTLISLGVQAENILVIWDLDQGLVLQSVRVQSHSTNAVLVNNYLKDADTADHIHFCTIGSKGHFCFWQYTFEENDLGYSEVEANLDLMATDFVCGSFSPIVQDQQMVLLGCSDGSLVSYDVNKIEWCENGMKSQLIKSGQIGAISIKNQSVVLVTSEGQIIKYALNGARVLPPIDSKQIFCIQHECGITTLCMDDLHQEGIVGTIQGNLVYVSLAEQQTVKVVSRASESLDRIGSVVLDPSNQAVFMAQAGDHSSEVKIFATSTMDQITTFKHFSQSPVRFIAAFAANKHQKLKLRLFGHANGELKFVTLETLKVEFAYKIELNEEEELTEGCFSHSGHNFAVGTSQGNIYFGHFKKDQKTKTTVVKIAKLKGLSKSEAHAVTSLEMTAFSPDGLLMAAFDNGEVRVWRSFYQDSDADKPKRKNVGKKPVDIADLGNMQFDIVDNFNMFQNPHGLDNLTEEDQNQLAELYSGKSYRDCRARLCPAQNDFYVSSVSALQYLFVRNYNRQETVKRIALMYFPTSISVADYATVVQENELGKGQTDGQIMAAVGTQEGRVLVYRLDVLECSSKVVCRTQAGLVFGQVASCSLSENGQVMLAASNSGELMSFDLRDCVKTASDE